MAGNETGKGAGVTEKKWESCFPPGYEHGKREGRGAAFLLAVGAVLSLRFFGRLYGMVRDLYVYAGRERMLREDAEAVPFWQLTRGHWMPYMPYCLFLIAVMLYHYSYYYRETKSIYLMRRLPAKGAVTWSCVRGPLLGMAAGAAAFGLLQLLYYGIYLLAVGLIL